MSTIATYMKTGQDGMTLNRVPRMEQFILNFATTNVTQNDLVTIFQCPEDYVVFAFGYEILISGTASGTIAAGKADGAELLTAAALDAAVGTKANEALAAPVFFEDSDTIDVDIEGATMILGKVRVWWVGCDVTEKQTVNDLA